MSTAEDRARWAALAAAATPGPWEAYNSNVYDVQPVPPGRLTPDPDSVSLICEEAEPNTDFIAAARTAVPELLADVARLEAQLRAVRDSALEEAAKILDTEVESHRADQSSSGYPHGGDGDVYFCEDYGCGSLVDFAKKIRALRGTK